MKFIFIIILTILVFGIKGQIPRQVFGQFFSQLPAALKTGFPDDGLPSHDPFLRSMQLEYEVRPTPNKLNIYFTDLQFKGASNFEIYDFDISDPGQQSDSFDVTYVARALNPHLYCKVEGTYYDAASSNGTHFRGSLEIRGTELVRNMTYTAYPDSDNGYVIRNLKEQSNSLINGEYNIFVTPQSIQQVLKNSSALVDFFDYIQGQEASDQIFISLRLFTSVPEPNPVFADFFSRLPEVLRTGYLDQGIPPHDPYRKNIRSTFQIDPATKIDAYFTQLTLKGISNFQVDDFKVSSQSGAVNFQVQATQPHLSSRVEGVYYAANANPTGFEGIIEISGSQLIRNVTYDVFTDSGDRYVMEDLNEVSYSLVNPDYKVSMNPSNISDIILHTAGLFDEIFKRIQLEELNDQIFLSLQLFSEIPQPNLSLKK